MTVRTLAALGCATFLIFSGMIGCERESGTAMGPVAVIEGEVPVHGMLGLEFAPTTAGHPLIADVLPGSPAQEAGIVAGDTIASINGQALDSIAQLQARMRLTKPGDLARLELIKGQQTRSVDVRLIGYADLITLETRARERQRGQ